MKNKIINLSVAVALLIVCLVSFITGGGASIAGAGNGKNARVTNIKEFTEVLNFLTRDESFDVALASFIDDGSNYDEEDSEEPEKTVSKHSSATVHVSTIIKASSHSTNHELTGGTASSTQSLERELTCYFTESASYYVSKGVSFVSVERYVKDENGNGNYKDSTELINFDMEILLTDDKSYVRFHEFNYITDEGSLVIKSENTNKWIDMPYGFLKSMVDVDLDNREIFEGFGEMFAFLIEEGKIKESDSSVSFDSRELANIFEDAEGSSPFNPEDYTIDFNVDLSNPTRPSISLNNVYNHKEEYSISEGYKYSGTVEQKVKNDQKIVIYNIDNTVVNWKDSYVDITADAADDKDTEDFLEEIFDIEEYEED